MPTLTLEFGIKVHWVLTFWSRRATFEDVATLSLGFMLELYQFEMSHYAEKVRLVLDYKGLDYRKIEVVPGIGQLELFQKTGQRQVPVLKDGDTMIADSTAIVHYLDNRYPEKPVIPTETKERGLCLIMERWADEVFGIDARKGLLSCMSQNPNFRTALLPDMTPAPLRSFISGLPVNLLSNLAAPVGLGADKVREVLRDDLRYLSAILATQAYLVGDQPTVADFTVAAMSMYVKFPTGYVNLPAALQGEGVPGIADSPEFEAFFAWRDRLYENFRHPPSNMERPTVGNGSGPTAISID
jgi:glutathione S-transferase